MTIPLALSRKQFVYLGEGRDCARAEAPAKSASVEPRGILEDIDQNPTRISSSVHQRLSQHSGVSNTEGAMASRMESMVDDLMRSAASKPAGKRSSMIQDPAAASTASPLAQAPGERGTPPLQSAPFNVQDLVQRMQQPASASQPTPRAQAFNLASLPSIYNTPFAPRPGETPESPRPSSAHRASQSLSNPQNLNSSANFQANLSHLADEVQMRTFPQSSFQPTPSSHDDTPTNITSWVRAADQAQPPSSPWPSSFASARSVKQTPISTKPPSASPFGAVGESRPRSSHTPNSGQPG